MSSLNSPDIAHLWMLTEEFHRANDRALGVLVGSLLDLRLENLLKAYFIADSTLDEDLFGDRDPAGTFSNQIDLAYYLGLITPSHRCDLHRIRKVRNHCAHEVTCSFELSPLRDFCAALSTASEAEKTKAGYLPMREHSLGKVQYVLAASKLIWVLEHWAPIVAATQRRTALTDYPGVPLSAPSHHKGR